MAQSGFGSYAGANCGMGVSGGPYGGDQRLETPVARDREIPARLCELSKASEDLSVLLGELYERILPAMRSPVEVLPEPEKREMSSVSELGKILESRICEMRDSLKRLERMVHSLEL